MKRSPGALSLESVVASLRRTYGKPKPPPARGPFEQILWENVAYLASDARRGEAFAMLRQRVGLSPEKILAAPEGVLLAIGGKGVLPGNSAAKLREIARIALEKFGGDLRRVPTRPTAEAMRALRKFPSIGEPGAEKILVFSGALRALALDSNALRVLRRLGFGEDGRSYSATYRLVQRALAAEIPKTTARRVEASLLLRRHGQEICKSSRPRCEVCPLRLRCRYASALFIES